MADIIFTPLNAKYAHCAFGLRSLVAMRLRLAMTATVVSFLENALCQEIRASKLFHIRSLKVNVKAQPRRASHVARSATYLSNFPLADYLRRPDGWALSFFQFRSMQEAHR